MSAADRSVLPPVRLPDEAELARHAQATPLLSRAVELARWVGAASPGVRVGLDGELLPQELQAARRRLGLTAPDGPSRTREAWDFALRADLVRVAGPDPAADGVGVATAGGALARVAEGNPAAVLEVWAEGVAGVLADAAVTGPGRPGAAGTGADEPFEPDEGGGDGGLVASDELHPADEPDDLADLDEVDAAGLGWRPGEEAELLDAALGTLYLFTVSDEGFAAGAMVPLPMLAAAVVMPEDVTEPSPDDLDEVSAVVMLLDARLHALAAAGLVEYVPAVAARSPDGGAPAGTPTDAGAAPEPGAESQALAEAVAAAGAVGLDSLGQVRLTPLGRYGVRRRMVEAGLDAPVVGDLCDRAADALLAAIPHRPEAAAREEAELWLAGRDPLQAARELLAAARGTDPGAPARRLGCQLVLSLLDERGEPALREVLHDPELGGLARVWLVERGVEVPAPSEEMVFWLTIDTLAAQLGPAAGDDAADAEELGELVRDLTLQHDAFFERAWRSEHPATAEVLAAMGRLHPDRELAKQARRAAFKARSRP